MGRPPGAGPGAGTGFGAGGSTGAGSAVWRGSGVRGAAGRSGSRGDDGGADGGGGAGAGGGGGAAGPAPAPEERPVSVAGGADTTGLGDSCLVVVSASRAGLGSTPKAAGRDRVGTDEGPEAAGGGAETLTHPVATEAVTSTIARGNRRTRPALSQNAMVGYSPQE
jgi:hypothetical protein